MQKGMWSCSLLHVHVHGWISHQTPLGRPVGANIHVHGICFQQVHI